MYSAFDMVARAYRKLAFQMGRSWRTGTHASRGQGLKDTRLVLPDHLPPQPMFGMMNIVVERNDSLSAALPVFGMGSACMGAIETQIGLKPNSKCA